MTAKTRHVKARAGVTSKRTRARFPGTTARGGGRAC